MAPAAMEVAPAPVAVVAVPFPAQGHLNQMLHLSLLLASRGLDVHYAAPAPHVRQARARVQGWDARAVRSLHFATLDIPPYATPPPDPDSPVAFPGHLQPLFDAFCDHAGAPLRRLLEELAASHHRVVVVHDNLVAFPASEASRLPNGDAYALQCVGQSFGAGFKNPSHRLVRALGLPVPSPESFLTEEFMELVARQGGLSVPGAGLLLNSCRALEGEFIDAQAETLSLDGKKLFSIGPLNPVLELDVTTPAPSVQPQPQPRHECMDWLDKQPTSSVLYLCFGTMTSLPGKQIEELAGALQSCEQRFIWVLRDADRADIFAEAGESRHAKLMSEFTRRTEGRGLVITGWAPQLEILAHGATAAFVSHCGWNSLLEGLSHGKPILAWPMHSDQPWNAGYVCGHLKAGIVMRPWEKSRETLPAKEIQEVIKRAIDSDEGIAAQSAAKALAEDVRAAVANGGSSWADMEEFVGRITK
ncbi:cis-zeatin O-glucosyltransferase 2 [Aegilops tauschii subsp. strangulata]|uniref:Glycosyltransferase n=2 Tax=Aegilops tauschii TaxID=37682 RepID=A0A453CNS8_AEGTS|nr:cis-zeatin O-glucosyltransferase 2 [Aegilops tauschii subsp. strangulata]